MLQGGHSPGAWHRVVRADLCRDQDGSSRSWCCTRSAVPRSCTSAGRPDWTSSTVIRRLHEAGLDSFAGAGAEMLVKRPRTAIAPLKESGETLARGHGDRTPPGRGIHRDVHDGHRRDERRAHRAPAHDPRRAGSHRRLPVVHPVDVPAGEQPPEGADAGHVPRVPADDRHRPAVLRQHRPPAGILADHRQGHRPADAALRRGRSRLGDAGGERRLLGRRAAPLQPHRTDRADPRRRARPRPARHASTAIWSCTTIRRTTRSTHASTRTSPQRR